MTQRGHRATGAKPARPKLLGVVAGTLCTCASGCGPPSADVLAVWVEERAFEEAAPDLQVYDAGNRYQVSVPPATPGSSTDKLQVVVDRRGSGFALSGQSDTAYQDLRTRLRPRLGPSDFEGRRLDAEFSFTRNGDAIIQAFVEGLPTELAFLPTTQPESGGTILSVPDTNLEGRSFALTSARDAAVLYWIEQATNPTRAAGRVFAVAYPSRVPGAAPGVAMPTVLARGELFGRGIDTAAFGPRIGAEFCDARVCVSPDGSSLTAMGPGPCMLVQWRWTEALSPDDEVPARSITLPESCPAQRDPHVWAQLADDVVALDDSERLYWADITAGVVQSVPKLGSRTLLAPIDGGRGYLRISDRAQVVRIDEGGVRIVNAERSACLAQNPDTVVSPSGNWVIQSCVGDGAFLPDDQAQLYRVSGLGLEAFVGIPMRPLAVDDEGNALLYSYDATTSSESPRGLFVLAGDGRLSRIDDLEPAAEEVSGTDPMESGRFFAAAPIVR